MGFVCGRVVVSLGIVTSTQLALHVTGVHGIVLVPHAVVKVFFLCVTPAGWFGACFAVLSFLGGS